jgi:hypothetical protein
MDRIELLSVVALVEDRIEKGLVRGQVGTVVENLAPGLYEVEFIDDSGQTYASLALRANQLMRLHHKPSHQAA